MKAFISIIYVIAFLASYPFTIIVLAWKIAEQHCDEIYDYLKLGRPNH